MAVDQIEFYGFNVLSKIGKYKERLMSLLMKKNSFYHALISNSKFKAGKVASIWLVQGIYFTGLLLRIALLNEASCGFHRGIVCVSNRKWAGRKDGVVNLIFIVAVFYRASTKRAV
jgi:hypothetical protein